MSELEPVTKENHMTWQAREKVIALMDHVDDENQVVQDELAEIERRLCLVGQAIDTDN